MGSALEISSQRDDSPFFAIHRKRKNKQNSNSVYKKKKKKEEKKSLHSLWPLDNRAKLT